MSTPKKKQADDVILAVVADDDLTDEPDMDHPWTPADDEAVANYEHPHPDFGGVKNLALPVGS